MFSDAQLQKLRRCAGYFVRRFHLHSVEPDDLLHDVLVSVLLHRDEIESPFPYAWSALRLRAYYVANAQRRPLVPLDPDLPFPAADPDRQILAHQLLSHRRLSSQARRLLLLSTAGFTAEQMALSLDLAVSSVPRLLGRAREFCFLRVTRASRRSGSSLHLRSSAL